MLRELATPRARAASVGCGSTHLRGAAPLGVQPNENSQRGNFDRSLANKIEAQDTREVLGRHIGSPNYASRGDQASDALFGGNAEERSPLVLGLAGGLGHGRVYWLLRQVKIGFASAVPAHISGLMIFGHCTHNDTRVSSPHVTEVWCNGLVGYLSILGFKVIQPFQYSGGCPSGRVFHRRCTHSHWSGYLRT